MSDFDKEAEREKLREKYEQEEEKRKTTEQMSELLLKGATMTNAHCSDCGDPIFRYDGQEFCPTCEKPVDRGTEDQATGNGEQGADSDAEQVADAGANAGENGTSDNIEVTDPSDDASVQFGSGGTSTGTSSAADQTPDEPPEQRQRDSPGETGTESPDRTTPSQDQTAPSPNRTAPSPDQTVPSRDRTASSRDVSQDRDVGSTGNADDVRQIPSAAPSRSTTPDQPSAGAGDTAKGGQASGSVADHLDQAQLVLAETIERHARLAAAADSPRETRDHLETAREAAETLDATGY